MLTESRPEAPERPIGFELGGSAGKAREGGKGVRRGKAVIYSALLRKEWRQLRRLRWACTGLGVVTPIVLIVIGRAGRPGLLPFSRSVGNDDRELLSTVGVLVVGLVFCPLFALFMSSEAFSADRASGTEGFLAERPIARRSVWLARLATSAVSAIAVCGAGLVALVAVAALDSQSIGRAVVDQMIAMGPGALALPSLLAFASGAAAASLLGRALPAAMLGGALTALPLITAVPLSRLAFPASIEGGEPVLVLPISTLLAYLAVSYLTLCRGEPAGGRRVRRWSFSIAGLVGLALVATVGASAFALKLRTSTEFRGFHVVPSSEGSTLLVQASPSGACSLVDVASGKLLGALEGRAWGTVWSRDGKSVIVERAENTAGVLMETRLDTLDRYGRPVRSSIDLKGAAIGSMIWMDDHVIGSVAAGGMARVLDGGIVELSLRTSEIKRLMTSWDGWLQVLVGPTLDGRVYVAKAPDGATLEMDTQHNMKRTRYSLYRVDVDRGRLEDEPLLTEEAGYPSTADARLSPSGRYWIRDSPRAIGSPHLIRDLTTGREIDVGHFLPGQPAPGEQVWDPRWIQSSLWRSYWSWLADDSIAWIERVGDESRLEIARADEPPRTLRVWKNGWVLLRSSPDLRRILITASRAAKDGAPESLESLVYDGETGETIALEPWQKRPGSSLACSSEHGCLEDHHVMWAGPRKIAHLGRDAVALEDVDPPHTFRWIIGGPHR